jgi:hypothetical protein
MWCFIFQIRVEFASLQKKFHAGEKYLKLDGALHHPPTVCKAITALASRQTDFPPVLFSNAAGGFSVARLLKKYLRRFTFTEMPASALITA